MPASWSSCVKIFFIVQPFDKYLLLSQKTHLYGIVCSTLIICKLNLLIKACPKTLSKSIKGFSTFNA